MKRQQLRLPATLTLLNRDKGLFTMPGFSLFSPWTMETRKRHPGISHNRQRGLLNRQRGKARVADSNRFVRIVP